VNALLTTTVGSFPKPPYLARARNDFAVGKLTQSELHELTEKATREVIAMQEELGLDVLVHGEMERGDMVGYFGEIMPGMATGGLVRSYGNRYYHKPVIKEAVRWESPLTLDWWRFAQNLTERPVKGMLTGPYTIVEWSFDAGRSRGALYPDRRASGHYTLRGPANPGRGDGRRHGRPQGQDDLAHVLRGLRLCLP
jgi:5-methyltetrahydropteroyltriglutamate--homocysteine methyltransferase